MWYNKCTTVILKTLKLCTKTKKKGTKLMKKQMTTGEAVYQGLRRGDNQEACKKELFNELAQWLLKNTDWEDESGDLQGTETKDEILKKLDLYKTALELCGGEKWEEYKTALFALAFMALLNGERAELEKVIERLKNNSYTILTKNHIKCKGRCLIYPNDKMKFLVIEQDLQKISSEIPYNEEVVKSSPEDTMYYILKLLYERESDFLKIFTEDEVEKLWGFDVFAGAKILHIDIEELMKDRDEIEEKNPDEILKPSEGYNNIVDIIMALSDLLKESLSGSLPDNM